MLDVRSAIDTEKLGEPMYKLVETLYPICRSITGDGVRQTLAHISEHVPLTIHEVATGTPAFDWAVPKEWNIRDAYVKNPHGEKIIDFQKSNLHVLNYSVPVAKTVSLNELKSHLFTLPNHPDWIPYRTSYYKDNWGFCLSQNQFDALEEGSYEVVIDSSLKEGHLSYGEIFIPGMSEQEVLFSCHVCHPSLCNDNLSGIALTTFLAKTLSEARGLRYSYRFIFIPATIGSIVWLSRNEDKVARIKHGLIVTCVGDAGVFMYKKSRRGNAEIDRAVTNVLKHSAKHFEVIDFYPYGYDERQFCSPGFDLAVGSLSRSTHGRYPEYHSSADNLALVKPEYICESLNKYVDVIEVLENNRYWINQNPKCEPQLGKRGLYGSVGASGGAKVNEMALLWVLNLTDGKHDLLQIAERSGLAFREVARAAAALAKSGLLKEVSS